MLDHEIMMSTTIYPSVLHTKHCQRKFCNALRDSVKKLEYLITNSPNIAQDRLKLIGPTEPGFKRTQTL